MAGKLVVNTINTDTVGAVFTTQNAVTGIAKAWVNFNGVTTATIRDSFNVSSVTRNGTGDYTVNFTTAMPNANYAVEFGSSNGTSNLVGLGFVYNSLTAPTTSAVRVGFVAMNGASQPLTDASICSVAIFSS